MRPGYSLTTKEGKQYKNAGDPLVDFFRSAAAQRQAVLQKQDNLFQLFGNAYEVNKEVATKLVFWLRDPRRGAGEKAASRKLFQVLFEANPDFIYDNLDVIVKYGYWKDLIMFLDDGRAGTNQIAEYWAEKIKGNDGLAAKWAPRLHSKYHNAAVKIKDAMGVSNAEYRKILKDKSNTVEQVMTQGLWDSIVYDHVPSNAMKIYKKAFRTHDVDRFVSWITSDKTKANAGAIYPHEILMMSYAENEHELAQKMWDNLPDFIKSNEKFMVMLDTSGSMECGGFGKITPAIIGVALTIYLAERNSTEFKNTFLSFSERPHIIGIPKTGTLAEKYRKIMRTDWGGTTNFEAGYRLILEKAVANKLRQSDMPTMLLILSDMQFDGSVSGDTHLKSIQDEYKKWGYKVPKLVFWNLNEAYTGSPATSDDRNVGLVSGFSPSLMEAVLACKSFLPIDLVMETVKKYEGINTKSLPELVEIDDAIIRCNKNGWKTKL